jgi:hypothetical protein
MMVSQETGAASLSPGRLNFQRHQESEHTQIKIFFSDDTLPSRDAFHVVCDFTARCPQDM